MIKTTKERPKFNKWGHLPRKCYEMTIDEIEEYFVNNFPKSKSRKSRWECFLNFYNELTKNVKSCVRIIIDGSFVENKINPFDIDLVVVIDYEHTNNYEYNYLYNECEYNEIIKREYLILKNQVNNGNEDFSKLLETEFYKSGCDIHFFIKYPSNHPLYNTYEKRLNYWIDLFSKNRDNYSKGFLNLNVEYGDV